MTRVLTALLVLALCASAQNSQQQDARQIVTNSMSAWQRSTRLRYSYTYRKQEVDRALDSFGQLKATHSMTSEIMYFAGKPYEHVLEKDGKPLPSGESRKEEQKMRHAAEEAGRLTENEKADRMNKLDNERLKQTEIFTFLPAAYNWTIKPDVTLNSRATYVFGATAKPNYSGKYGGIFRKTKATFFIDKQDYTLVRMEADILDNMTFGLFLFSLSKGIHITFEQVRVNDEIWFPKMMTARYAARAVVKTLRGEAQTTYSDYRKYQSESRVVAAGAIQ